MILQSKNRPSSCVLGNIWLANGLDASMFSLLRSIDETGSINQAAKQVGLSYKTAWMMIERANNKSPKMLISSETGGAKGGGTHLTDSGRKLINLFNKLEDQHQQFLSQLNQVVTADAEILKLLKYSTIKNSAANQLFGVVTSVKPGIINTEVSVKLKGGENICVSLSQVEAESLDLEIGKELLALINYSDISLFVGPENYSVSARNQFEGLISRVELGEVDAKVIIYLRGGDSLTVSITQQSAVNMQLKTGMQCRAVLKSNSILLAVL